jgi:hypothetical protein
VEVPTMQSLTQSPRGVGCLPLAIAAGLAAMAVDAFGGDETEVAP